MHTFYSLHYILVAYPLNRVSAKLTTWPFFTNSTLESLSCGAVRSVRIAVELLKRPAWRKNLVRWTSLFRSSYRCWFVGKKCSWADRDGVRIDAKVAICWVASFCPDHVRFSRWAPKCRDAWWSRRLAIKWGRVKFDMCAHFTRRLMTSCNSF